MARVVVGVVGIARVADEGGEVEPGHAAGRVVEEVVVGEGRCALGVREVGEAAGVVEPVIGQIGGIATKGF